MGKKKAGTANLGKSIIRARFGKNVNKTGESFLHTSELSDGYEWGRLNLQSVTEQSNLDDFLATAELAGTEFTAEKLNISIVSHARQAGLLSKFELNQVTTAQEEHKDMLKIPRRPPWDESTTPDELDARERTEFLNWRRSLAELQEVENILLTPYEKNLDFWRQLWRVIERSDVVVQIVDARNPLLFRCVDLEKYVKEVHPDKINLVLVNKADYLNETQRKLWSDYFQKDGVLVAFWSALEESKNQDAKNSEETDDDNPFEMIDDESESDEDDDEEEEEEKNMEEINNDNNEESTTLSSRGDNCQKTGTQSDAPLTASGPNSEMQAESNEPMESDSAKTGSSNVSLNQPISDSVSATTEGVLKSRTETESGLLYSSETVCDSQSSRSETRNCWDILSGEELLEMFRSIHTTNKVNEGHTTIGMVGYPNVGKSSTINAILKMKKVPVSTTPGRTKHFQTLFVEKELMLCDCPGLVFPSFVITKAELIVNGVLPIDQMRDHVPPVALVCQRIPRPVLESIYGVNLPIPGECEDPNRPPSAQEFLNAHGYMRGYMTANGQPDNPRSSRYVLKDYVNGKLLFCLPPPGVDEEVFQPTNQMTEEYPQDNKPHQLESSPTEVSVGSKNNNARVVPQSAVDKEFFKKSDPKLRSKGIRGVTGFARTNTMGEHIPSSSGSTDGSTQNLAEKPWKKHKNRNKKEKSRRIHEDLNP